MSDSTDDRDLARAADDADGAAARVDQQATPEDVEEQLRRHGVRLGRGGITPGVFWPALVVVVGVTIVTIAFPATTGDLLTTIQEGLVSGLGWYYLLVVAGFILFTAWMGFSRFGDIKLGRGDEPPEFGVWSWFAMLFAAGMAIGLVFYGVGQPLIFATSDPKPSWDGSAAELAQLGMAQTFVHQAIHPWAVYVVTGLALSCAIHRRGRPVSIRWALEPLLGDRVKGWPGDVIDALAVVGTLFGVATSLGLGVQQIATGMAHIGVLDQVNQTVLIVLIVVITLVATASVVSGLGRGIRWLSNINMSMAGVLLVAVLLLRPTLFIFRSFVQSLGVYLANVLDMTFDAAAYSGSDGQAWLGDWTVFFWAWWIAWAPFVGIFIARISRGRTIREFVAGALLVPALVGFVWFAVMGGTGLHRQLFGAGDLVPEGGVVVEESLFDVLAGLPLGGVLSVIAIVLVAIFFITSSDSGSLVVDMLVSGGHPDPRPGAGSSGRSWKGWSPWAS